MRKIGFTGTQEGMTEAQKVYMTAVLDKDVELHHGDCLGADAEVYVLAKTNGSRTVCHPPTNPYKRAFSSKNDEVREARDYLDRNHDIVDETQRLYATPKSNVEEHRSGTWATIRYARKKRLPITIIYPDGQISKENQ